MRNSLYNVANTVQSERANHKHPYKDEVHAEKGTSWNHFFFITLVTRSWLVRYLHSAKKHLDESDSWQKACTQRTFYQTRPVLHHHQQATLNSLPPTGIILHMAQRATAICLAVAKHSICIHKWTMDHYMIHYNQSNPFINWITINKMWFDFYQMAFRTRWLVNTL